MMFTIFQKTGYLTGKILLSTPFNPSKEFEKSVVFICGHDDKGAMGVIINKQLSSLSLKDVLQYLTKPLEAGEKDAPLYYGGAQESTRGFVIHTPEYKQEKTLSIKDSLSLTATLEVLTDIMEGNGPQQALLALGYCLWKSQNLEKEIFQNHWTMMDATKEIIFSNSPKDSWQECYDSLGINPFLISMEKGCA